MLFLCLSIEQLLFVFLVRNGGVSEQDFRTTNITTPPLRCTFMLQLIYIINMDDSLLCPSELNLTSLPLNRFPGICCVLGADMMSECVFIP